MLSVLYKNENDTNVVKINQHFPNESLGNIFLVPTVLTTYTCIACGIVMFLYINISLINLSSIKQQCNWFQCWSSYIGISQRREGKSLGFLLIMLRALTHLSRSWHDVKISSIWAPKVNKNSKTRILEIKVIQASGVCWYFMK